MCESCRLSEQIDFVCIPLRFLFEAGPNIRACEATFVQACAAPALRMTRTIQRAFDKRRSRESFHEFMFHFTFLLRSSIRERAVTSCALALAAELVLHG